MLYTNLSLYDNAYRPLLRGKLQNAINIAPHSWSRTVHADAHSLCVGAPIQAYTSAFIRSLRCSQSVRRLNAFFAWA